MDNDLEKKALVVVEQAKAITVKDNDSLQKANEMLTGIKALRKEIVNTFKPIKQAIDNSKKEVLEKERKHDAPLAEAQDWLSAQMSNYYTEQEKIRKAEEDRLREIARKQEQERIEAERKADEERRIQEALNAEASGNKEEAEAILKEEFIPEPVFTPEPIVPQSTPKLQGTTFRENWKFRISDPMKVPRKYLKVDEVMIGQVVRAEKGRANIPGVDIYCEKTTVGTRF